MPKGKGFAPSSKPASQAREDSILNPSPCSSGGGVCVGSRHGADAGSSGHIVKERASRTGGAVALRILRCLRGGLDKMNELS